MMHAFPLRRSAGLHKATYETTTIDLPDDLSHAEVERLCRWLRTLPHDDPNPVTSATPAENIDNALKSLVFMLHIYSGYTIGSRGPAGCIFTAISALSADVAHELEDTDARAVYARRWPEPTEGVQ